MNALFCDVPNATENTIELSSRLKFELDDLGYQFPGYAVPDGETMDSFLRKRVVEGVQRRYGPKKQSRPLPMCGEAGVSDRKSRADGLVAQASTDETILHHKTSRSHPTGTDSRGYDPPLFRAANGKAACNVSASLPQTGSGTHLRCAALSRATAQDGDDCRQTSVAPMRTSCGAP
jgi:hypothetical protein